MVLGIVIHHGNLTLEKVGLKLLWYFYRISTGANVISYCGNLLS
jgi:hypothetical protein